MVNKKFALKKCDSLVEMVLKILLNAKYLTLSQISDDLNGYFRQKRILFEIEKLEVQLSFSRCFRTNKKYIARELPDLMELLLEELRVV